MRIKGDTMRKQTLIANRSDGPYKVPFKKNTPVEIQAVIKAMIPLGKKTIVPPELYEFLDLERLEQAAKKRDIKLTIRDLSEPKVYVEPKKRGRPKKSKEIKVEKVERDIVINDKKEDK